MTWASYLAVKMEVVTFLISLYLRVSRPQETKKRISIKNRLNSLMLSKFQVDHMRLFSLVEIRKYGTQRILRMPSMLEWYSLR